MRIEGLEAALNEVKINSRIELDKAQMAQAEAESIYLNMNKDDKTAAAFLLEHQSNLSQIITRLDSQKLIQMYSDRIYQQHLINGKTRKILDGVMAENKDL